MRFLRRRQRQGERKALDEEQRDALLGELLTRLEERGAPEGIWLIDIAAARKALQEVDALLRRLQDALIRDASGSPRPGS